MKRVFCLILALIIVISLVTLPAFAASEDESYIDLLTASEYLIGGETLQSPSFLHAGKSYVFSFGDGANLYTSGEFHICIQSAIVPSSVRVFMHGNNAKLFTYSSSQDNLHYFSLIGSAIDFADYFTVTINFSSALTEVVSIESFKCLSYSNYQAFDSVGVRITGTGYESEDQSYYSIVAVHETASLPYTSDLDYTNFPAELPTDNYLNDFFTFDFDVNYADQFVMTFISTGVWPNYYDHDGMSTFGITLNSESGSTNLSYTSASAIMDSTWYGLPVYRHTVYVDLAGYNLSDSSLTVSVNVSPRFLYRYWNGAYQDIALWFIRIESAGFFQASYEITWFQRITYFFRGWFDVFHEIFNSIDSGINSGFNALEDKLDSIFSSDVVPDVSDQQQAIADSVDDMDNAAQDFENSRSDLEGLMPDMPTWEDTGLGNLAVDYSAHISQILTVFTAIYENTIITQILTFTFLFALGGFILFGER